MKKMTAEGLRRVALLTREWSAQGGLIPSQQLILDLQQHIAALEAEAAQARERALEEAAECAVRPGWKTRDCDEVAADIRALKSTPAQEAMDCDPRTFGDVEPPKKPRREHEYGTEYVAEFGSKVANCTRGRCQAYRVRSRDGKHIYFSDGRPGTQKTDEPGPCEVEP